MISNNQFDISFCRYNIMSKHDYSLCYNEVFPSSYSVLMYFHEKKIEFEAQRIDVLATVSNNDIVVEVPMLRKKNSDKGW